MKVIDLLNKIANGEEVPKKIRYNNVIFTYYENADEIRKLYIYEKHNIFWFDRDFFNLDTEIEIIEEDKEIDKINKPRMLKGTTENESKLLRYCADLENKLIEVIDVVNELNKKEPKN